MVKLCKEQYTQEKYNDYFNRFPFKLSDFQKYAIEAIITNNHILITAHTGSGKTLPAEFAIEHLKSKGKKIIYTSPIKALSNQKFHELSKKFPTISFGILTGDIKFNPEADVLIMTTEILRNTLLYKSSEDSKKDSLIQFDMDFEKELGGVVFDEVHYINDPDRGTVWEETIMLLPPHVQMVMLSATIDKPEIFAQWIENKPMNTKEVYLAPTNHRVVPLIHYSYNFLTDGIIKTLKDKDKEFYSEIKNDFNKPLILKDYETKFNRENLKKAKKIKEYINKKNLRISPKHVLNQLTKYLDKNGMLPAICFVFSRKMVESYADSIETSLFEEDSTVPSTIEQECRMILQKRIANYKEYLVLPEFQTIIKLLQKGIAIHHSGILPILREMIELLFSKGYIKLLFATETFAVGLNMPTKTVIMSSFTKFNGSSMRYLFPHEYTQMAGRAGRRGIDTIGHVIHCNNLFDFPYDNEYNNILNGSPLPLESKYEISHNTILTMINNNCLDNITNFSKQSLVSNDIIATKNNLTTKRDMLDIELYKYKTVPLYNKISEYKEKIDEYNDLQQKIPNLRANQQKKAKRKIEDLEKDAAFKNIFHFYIEFSEKEEENKRLAKELETINQYFENKLETHMQFLTETEFISSENQLNRSGNIARLIQELPSLLFGNLLDKSNFFYDLNEAEILTLFSCFNNIRVQDDQKRHSYKHIKTPENEKLCQEFEKMDLYYNNLMHEYTRFMIKPCDLDPNYDILEYIIPWIKVDNEGECRLLLENMKKESGIFLGEFIKAIIKLHNVIEEMKKVAEYFQEFEFLSKLNNMPDMILKFVATNQSLYV